MAIKMPKDPQWDFSTNLRFACNLASYSGHSLTGWPYLGIEVVDCWCIEDVEHSEQAEGEQQVGCKRFCRMERSKRCSSKAQLTWANCDKSLPNNNLKGYSNVPTLLAQSAWRAHLYMTYYLLLVMAMILKASKKGSDWKGSDCWKNFHVLKVMRWQGIVSNHCKWHYSHCHSHLLKYCWVAVEKGHLGTGGLGGRGGGCGGGSGWVSQLYHIMWSSISANGQIWTKLGDDSIYW